MSYLNVEASFRKGQADGVAGTLSVLTSIINGTDKGNNNLSSKELEKARRVLLMWRDYIIEKRNTDKNATSVLLQTKKIMDIPVSK